MKKIRITWRDTAIPPEYKPFPYAGYTVTGNEDGWSTGMPGDNNLYQTRWDAINAIKKYLGREETSTYKRAYQIRIVGKKNETA